MAITGYRITPAGEKRITAIAGAPQFTGEGPMPDSGSSSRIPMTLNEQRVGARAIVEMTPAIDVESARALLRALHVTEAAVEDASEVELGRADTRHACRAIGYLRAVVAGLAPEASAPAPDAVRAADVNLLRELSRRHGGDDSEAGRAMAMAARVIEASIGRDAHGAYSLPGWAIAAEGPRP